MNVAEELHLVHERLDALEHRTSHELATKDDLSSAVAQLRAEMASKEDLAQLRAEMATKEDLAQLRAEMASKEDLRRANMELYATVRQDIHQLRRDLKEELTAEIVSHVGALGDHLTELITEQVAWLDKRWGTSRGR